MTAISVRWCRLTVVTVAVLVLTACGVPTGGATRVLETQNVPYGLLRDRAHSTTGQLRSTAASGQTRSQIALVDGDSAVKFVDRDVATGQPAKIAGLLLEELVRGPTDAERRRGLDSAVSAGVRLRVVGWRRGVLSVDISNDTDLAPDRLPIAVAQIVLTATSTSGVRAVLFQHDDTGVQVPLVDGSLTSAALTRQDYQQLLDAGTPKPTVSEERPGS